MRTTKKLEKLINKELDALVSSKAIKIEVRQEAQEGKRLLRNRRPAADRKGRMSAEEAAELTAKETSDVKNLRKAMERPRNA